MPSPFDFPIAGRRRAPPAPADAAEPPPPAADAQTMPDVFRFPVAGQRAEAEADAAESTSATPPPGRFRREGDEPAWYEPLLESGISAVAGATSNLVDEATAGALWAGDKLGLSKSGNSYDENREMYKGQVDRMTDDYPYGHGAGQMGTGLAASMMVPGAGLAGIAAQGGVQGALSAASEYGDSHDLKSAGKAGAIGTAVGAGGAAVGNYAANLFSHVDPMKNLIRRGMMSADDMAGAPTQDILRRSGRPLEYLQGADEVADGADDIVRGSLSPDDMADAPAQDILKRSGRPLEYVRKLEPQTPADEIVRGPVSRAEGEALGFRDPAPQSAPPRAPFERREGLVTSGRQYDPPPAELEQMYFPTQPGRPAMSSRSYDVPHYDPDALTRQAPKLVRGPDGKLAKPDYIAGELDLAPAPPVSRALEEATGLPPKYGPKGDWYSEPAMLETLDVPPPQGPRAQGPELPFREEIIPGGRMPSGPAKPLHVLPGPPPPMRPGPIEARRASAQALDDIDLELGRPAMRPGPIEARRPSVRSPAEALELDTPAGWDPSTGAQRAAAKPTGGVLDTVLSATQHVPGLGLPSRLGRAGLRAVGAGKVPPAADALYPNEGARALTRGAAEAAWELGGPAAMGGKVNAQDREQPAYSDAATTHYALSAVLSSGASGLSPADEDVITTAMVQGNDQAVRAADFRLRMQNPAYARAVERELRSYQEGE